MNKQLIDIIIVTYNRFDLLTELLDKLNNQNIKEFNVIITDDGSSKLINPIEYDFVKMYLWHKNEGCCKVARLNEAFKLCESDYVLCMDDDVIPVYDNWIETHLDNLKRFDVSRGIVEFPNGGGNANTWFMGSNYALKNKTIEDIGYYDMNYNGNYGFDDNDFGEIIKENKLICSNFVENTKVIHKGVGYADNDRSEKIIGHNLNYFISKWGFDPRGKLYVPYQNN